MIGDWALLPGSASDKWHFFNLYTSIHLGVKKVYRIKTLKEYCEI